VEEAKGSDVGRNNSQDEELLGLYRTRLARGVWIQGGERTGGTCTTDPQTWPSEDAIKKRPIKQKVRGPACITLMIVGRGDARSKYSKA